MKKLLVAVASVGGLALGAATVAQAGGEVPAAPSLAVTPDTGEPGFEFALVVEPCPEGVEVTFEVPGDSQTTDCPVPNGSAFLTSQTFTAPAEPGTYPVAAILNFDPGGDFPFPDEPVDCLDVQFNADVCALFGEIEVIEPVVTTTTVAETTTTVAETTTTVAETTTTDAPTTDAPTTTIDDGSGVPVPTTNPVPGLPETGSGGGTAGLALLMLVFGGALVVVTRARRSA